MTGREKVEIAITTLVLLGLIAIGFGCGVGFFYWLVWGIS